MFGNLTIETRPNPSDSSKRSAPPAIPVIFPTCELPSEDVALEGQDDVPIAQLFKGLHRPTDVKVDHFKALGLRVVTDAAPEQLVPDTKYLPDKDWDSLSPEDAENLRYEPTRSLSNQKPFPSARTYVERRHELSIGNEEAFRTVRRLPLGPGEKRVRLGNAYEFFKNLELMSLYWRDTSLSEEEQTSKTEPDPAPIDADQATSNSTPNVRTRPKLSVPHEYRGNLISAFVKLVTYDFGCSVGMARVEPRLHLSVSSSTSSPNASPLHTYFQSSCSFVYRTPIARIEARGGIVEGPLAALSVRSQTSFANSQDSLLDFGKEMLALLITAQYRARQGRSEKRFGEGEWWTSARRWGGGSGGPVGKEIELVEKHEKAKEAQENDPSSPTNLPHSHKSEEHHDASSPSPTTRRAKKTRLQIYDSYRMVRPPSSTWDRKTKYMAIGKIVDSEHDDVFLISSLFHHVSFLRLRVPDSVVAELEGRENPAAEEKHERRHLSLWRSKWYDLFKTEDRIEALGIVWAIMGWLMRANDPPTVDVSTQAAQETMAAQTSNSASSPATAFKGTVSPIQTRAE